MAKAYRFLRAVLNTAFDDEVIRRNPCRIKGAAVEKPEERPVLTLGEVQLLAAAIDPRYRAFVLLAVFGSLRWGELMGLRRSDFDLVAGRVRIERAVSEIGARQVIKKPKTAAGIRTVALPRWLMPELRRHFDTYAESGQAGRVFIGPKGARPNTVKLGRDGGVFGLLKGLWPTGVVGAFDVPFGHLGFDDSGCCASAPDRVEAGDQSVQEGQP